jgi:hypothetical protein
VIGVQKNKGFTMPTYVTGELWDELNKADLLLVTTNSTLNARSELVMGAGAAGAMKERFPYLPALFGRYIAKMGYVNGLYGFQFAKHPTYTTQLGIFQTKKYYNNPSTPEIIAFSAGMLCANIYHYNFGRVAMNFPGSGLDGLSKYTLKPLLEPLPKNVYIYSKE